MQAQHVFRILTNGFIWVKINIIDRACMTRKFINYAPRCCVPDINKAITRPRGHFAAIW